MQLNIEKAPSIFQSLSDSTRLRILRLFLSTTDALCLCDVSTALSEPAYKISRHLKALREVGVLQAYREGRWLYHSISTEDRKARDLFKCIKSLADADGTLAGDLDRMKKLVLKRCDSQCRVRGNQKLGGRV